MAKQNGHTNGTAAQRNGQFVAKPRRPRGHDKEFSTPEESRKYQEYIDQLRPWLDGLSDEEHDKAVKKLTHRELFFINLETTYENYQKGGVLRELLEGTCFESAL